MTRTPTDTRLTETAADAKQLCERFSVPIRQRRHAGKITWIEQPYPPLLVQMHTAIIPSSGQEQAPERHRIPASKPPILLDPLDALDKMANEMQQWRADLGMRYLAGPPAANTPGWLLWHRASLYGMVGLAPTIAPSLADELADAVHGWWRTAATYAELDLDTLLAGRR